MVALALALTFAAAATSDALACAWHEARQNRAYAKGASLAASLELVQWAPVLLALDAQAPIFAIVGASVLGSVVGSLVGFRVQAR